MQARCHSSWSDRACRRPFRVGASGAAPIADMRTTRRTPACRAARTAFMLFSGRAGPGRSAATGHRRPRRLAAGCWLVEVAAHELDAAGTQMGGLALVAHQGPQASARWRGRAAIRPEDTVPVAPVMQDGGRIRGGHVTAPIVVSRAGSAAWTIRDSGSTVHIGWTMMPSDLNAVAVFSRWSSCAAFAPPPRRCGCRVRR